MTRGQRVYLALQAPLDADEIKRLREETGMSMGEAKRELRRRRIEESKQRFRNLPFEQKIDFLMEEWLERNT